MKTGGIQRTAAWALALTIAVACGSTLATPRCEGRLLRSEISERQEVTLSLLRTKDFANLQRRMDGFLAEHAAGRLSDEALFYEFGAFDRWGSFLRPLIAEWVERFPSSFAAHHAMALHLSAVAWVERGTAVAAETSPQQAARLKSGLLESRHWDLKAEPLYPRQVLVHALLLSNAKAIGYDTSLMASTAALPRPERSAVTPEPDLAVLLESGNRLEPDNVIVRQAYVSSMAPRWHGTLDALALFAQPERHSDLSPGGQASVVHAALMEIGDDYWFRGRKEPAVAAYQAAARMCRLNQPFINIGNIRLGEGRHQEALAAAEDALALVPESFAGQLMKARALRGLGRHAEAVALLQRLLPEGGSEVPYLLGEYYASGQGGLERDPAQARRLFGMAARAGNEVAARRLDALTKK